MQAKKKNRVYFAEGDPDDGGTYIAAPNIREAKRIATRTNVMNSVYRYIDLRVYWKRGIETDYEGELNIFQINELGLTWWCCNKCDNDTFELLDEYTYKCKKCGYEDEIPYIN